MTNSELIAKLVRCAAYQAVDQINEGTALTNELLRDQLVNVGLPEDYFGHAKRMAEYILDGNDIDADDAMDVMDRLA